MARVGQSRRSVEYIRRMRGLHVRQPRTGIVTRRNILLKLMIDGNLSNTVGVGTLTPCTSSIYSATRITHHQPNHTQGKI